MSNGTNRSAGQWNHGDGALVPGVGERQRSAPGRHFPRPRDHRLDPVDGRPPRSRAQGQSGRDRLPAGTGRGSLRRRRRRHVRRQLLRHRMGGRAPGQAYEAGPEAPDRHEGDARRRRRHDAHPPGRPALLLRPRAGRERLLERHRRPVDRRRAGRPPRHLRRLLRTGPGRPRLPRRPVPHGLLPRVDVHGLRRARDGRRYEERLRFRRRLRPGDAARGGQGERPLRHVQLRRGRLRPGAEGAEVLRDPHGRRSRDGRRPGRGGRHVRHLDGRPQRQGRRIRRRGRPLLRSSGSPYEGRDARRRRGYQGDRQGARPVDRARRHRTRRVPPVPVPLLGCGRGRAA